MVNIGQDAKGRDIFINTVILGSGPPIGNFQIKSALNIILTLKNSPRSRIQLWYRLVVMVSELFEFRKRDGVSHATIPKATSMSCQSSTQSTLLIYLVLVVAVAFRSKVSQRFASWRILKNFRLCASPSLAR